jgi:pimeloyl-ACP methyl ester carboxylesterase
VRVHVRRWGVPGAPLLFLLHGWRETSATVQFVVDTLRREWDIVAPDWAGFGESGWKNEYVHSGYAADLDALLSIYSPTEPVRLVAHSMAAGVCILYLGARPERVLAFANLDGLAPVPIVSPAHQLKRLRRWLDDAAVPKVSHRLASLDVLASTLSQRNPRLTESRALFLATHFARPHPEGGIEMLADPRQPRLPTPPSFDPAVLQLALEQFPRPVLWITGGTSEMAATIEKLPGGREILARRIAAAPQSRHVHLATAGHNVHHDEPERVAHLLEEFFCLAGKPESQSRGDGGVTQACSERQLPSE